VICSFLGEEQKGLHTIPGQRLDFCLPNPVNKILQKQGAVNGQISIEGIYIVGRFLLIVPHLLSPALAPIAQGVKGSGGNLNVTFFFSMVTVGLLNDKLLIDITNKLALLNWPPLCLCLKLKRTTIQVPSKLPNNSTMQQFVQAPLRANQFYPADSPGPPPPRGPFVQRWALSKQTFASNRHT
jgi:hypothetical protein